MSYSTCLLCTRMVSQWEKLCTVHEKEFPDFQDKYYWQKSASPMNDIAEQLRILGGKHPLVECIIESIRDESFYEEKENPNLISVNTNSIKAILSGKLIEYFSTQGEVQ